jgi:MFS family permease
MTFAPQPARPAVPQERPTRARYAVVGFALSMMAIAYLDRVCISIAAPSIQRDLALSDTQMAYVFSAFTLAYALFEVPSGWLADRLGARWMLARIVVWWSVMTAATGLATGFLSLLALRLLFGMGEAGALPSTSRAFARWLPARERGSCFGLTIMAGALGGALAQPLVAHLVETVSWRWSFPIFGIAGLVWASAWFAWFRDDPHTHRQVNGAELALIGADPPVARPPVPWRAILRHRGLLALCLMYGGAIYGWYFYLTWLPTYLLRARGFELRSVGWLAALPLLAIAFGVFAGGWLSDLLCRRLGPSPGRRLPGLVGLPAAALCVIAAVETPVPQTATYLLTAAAGLAALGVAPAWAVCLEIGGLHTGVLSGLMNTFGNLGGVLSPLVVGWCLDAGGSWNAPLLSVACLYVVAGACWLAVDPRKRIAKHPSY